MLSRKYFLVPALLILFSSFANSICLDLTNDNKVNLHDLVYAAKRIGTTDASADIDGDLSVTTTDVISLFGNLGICQSPLASCSSGSMISAMCRCSTKSYSYGYCCQAGYSATQCTASACTGDSLCTGPGFLPVYDGEPGSYSTNLEKAYTFPGVGFNGSYACGKF